MDPNPASVEPAFFQSVPVPLDSKYKGFILIIFVAICFPLLLFFVLLRSYVRIWVPRSFALDDGKRFDLQKQAPIYDSKLPAFSPPWVKLLDYPSAENLQNDSIDWYDLVWGGVAVL